MIEIIDGIRYKIIYSYIGLSGNTSATPLFIPIMLEPIDKED